jgi:hypothetical protein
MFSSIATIGLLAAAVKGQAIIGDGKVLLGVGAEGHLNIPYYGTILGLPTTDPAGVNTIGLRSPDGRYTAVEQGCLCEGWGAGIRRGDLGTEFEDECGSQADTKMNIALDRFSVHDANKEATSEVYCGVQKKLKVRHQFRTAKDRRGCDGAYEVKVTIQNRACDSVKDVIYRRVMDWDIDPSKFNELVTIQGTSKSDVLELSTNNGFCDMNPSSSCESTGSSIDAPSNNSDFVDLGPEDHGATFQINLGELKKDEAVIFRFFYGYFRSESEAKKCIKAGKMDLYSFGQDKDEQNTFLFGVRRAETVIKMPLGKGEKCVASTAGRDRRFARAAEARIAADEASGDDEVTGDVMTMEEKMAMNE